MLLLASVAAAWWALAPKNDASDWDAGTTTGDVSSPAAGKGKVQLLGATLERDYGNARLDLNVRIQNDGIHPLLLNPPKVRLLADEGAREVPAFFLPAERPPEVPAKTTTEVKLRYWLEASDLKGTLVLDVDGEQVPVKSKVAFDLTTIENAEPHPLKGVEW